MPPSPELHNRLPSIAIISASCTVATLLNKLFKHHAIPHEIWIGNDQKVKAITSSDYVTESNIEKLCEGKPLHLPIKNDYFVYDPKQSLSSYVTDDRLIQTSTLTGYADNLPKFYNSVIPLGDSIHKKIIFTNNDLLSLISSLLKNKFTPNRFILDVKDSSELLPDHRDESWFINHSYCYELVVNKNTPDSVTIHHALAGIGNVLNLKIQVIKKQMPCYELVKTRKGSINPLTKGGREVTVLFPPKEKHIMIHNRPVSVIATAMNSGYFGQATPIVLDGTNDNARVDIELPLSANQKLFTIRRRTKMGIRQAQLSGRYISMAPFGYKNAKQSDGKGIITIDPNRAPVIQKIYHDYLAGVSQDLILKEVIKLGFTKTGHGAIHSVLTNPVYAGLVRVVATEKEPEKLVKGQHEAIVSTDEYWRVQDLMTTNKRIEKIHPKEDFPLKGILKSSCCGGNMTAGWSKGKSKYYLYYRCIKHSSDNVPGIKVHEKFDELLSGLKFSEKQIAFIKDEVEAGLQEAAENRETQFSYKKELLTANQTKIGNLEEKFINNQINNATYSKWYRKLQIENARLKEEVYLLGKDADDKIKEQIRLLPHLINFKTIYEKATLRQKNAIIHQVFKQGIVFLKDSFRTPEVNPVFEHNLLKMKEKGLLNIEQPSSDLGQYLPRAEEEIRTPKPLRALPPQSSASTNFATSAWAAK